MIDVFSLSRRYTQPVNRDIDAILRRPNIFIGKDDVVPGGFIPAQYKDYPIKINVQAASSSDLQLLDNVQQQSDVRTVFIKSNLTGLNRPEQKGADILIFNGSSWLITVVKNWDSHKWSQVIVTRQVDTQQSAD